MQIYIIIVQIQRLIPLLAAQNVVCLGFSFYVNEYHQCYSSINMRYLLIKLFI